MKPTITSVLYNGINCLELRTDGYLGLFCPGLGANMLRFYDIQKEYEIFNFNENVSIEELKESICLHGLPSLYLPNRFSNGVIKTSDNIYNMPINEPLFNNFIHGWIHQREFKVIEKTCTEDYCSVSAEFVFDENDEYYEHFPLEHKITITYTLSNNGLEYTFEIINLSNKMLPVVVGAHTAFNLHFCKDSADSDIRLKANVLKKSLLNEATLCSTGEIVALDDYDLSIKNGTMNPLTTSIDNKMYIVEGIKNEDTNFYGVEIFDDRLKKGILYEASEEFKYWLFWNHWAQIGICCPEPMSALINSPNIPLDKEVTGYCEIKPNEAWLGRQRISTY